MVAMITKVLENWSGECGCNYYVDDDDTMVCRCCSTSGIAIHTSESLTPLPCRVVNHCHVVQDLDRT